VNRCRWRLLDNDHLNLSKLIVTTGSGHANCSSKFSLAYLGFKLTNLANVMVQFFILDKFLGSEYTLWGHGILRDLLEGRESHRSGHFPRVSGMVNDLSRTSNPPPTHSR